MTEARFHSPVDRLSLAKRGGYLISVLVLVVFRREFQRDLSLVIFNKRDDKSHFRRF